MLYDYLIANFDRTEPIFLSEIKGYSSDYVRQEMKRLTDEGKLERMYNGVYYIPYISILGTSGKISVKSLIDKKYVKNKNDIYGYYTGIYLLNKLGFTTQNPSVYEVCSNIASTKQRRLEIDGVNMIIYKPVCKINIQNYKELQFLDLILLLDKYSEIKTEEIKIKLKKYIIEEKINLKLVKELLPLYPDKIYKNLYYGGVMDELVRNT